MFYNSFLLHTIFATLYTSIFAFPTPSARDDHNGIRTLADAANQYPQLLPLADGNAKFRKSVAESDDPGLLLNLTVNGQHPEFVYFGCSDSRVSEGTVFSPPPGVLFTGRNIANQYSPGDLDAVATLAYGVTELPVGHVIVMGHYGCGGVQAAILNRPANLDRAGEAVQDWVEPIRQLYLSSTREEIVQLREYRAANPNAGPPLFNDSGYRALVEENVKKTVWSISQDSIVTDHWQTFLAEKKNGTQNTLQPLYIHGFVYDISTGIVYDLEVSQGPPGWSASKRDLFGAIRRGNADPNLNV